ncbi:ketoacyl-ACP synthase III [Phycicoccus endophyticus]|uniref:Beta-ketoacyl-[acyl-carrier-protein] synthase III n=1 Tax=Phycicoccus endophyticus TaxID=1690220 RepID=A0A7G9R3Z2_9MICO|nr:beta-ketoacyl-ACP synthase III [Phycicoccus endophyticus]NHI18155.1 ketoacyl-ACP synthase III [Phycicoccus endophyticus]QNN50317.1 ketoacyl-ACP synthase III [Phycicoccus endophyticus]GGL26021.1 3-oxoacyl-[acyl-carrier-protein] synthase 3 protein 1 [Phycicoccus endophyticus]
MTATSKGFADRLRTPEVTHARISGVGGYRPRRVVPNAELVERINSSDEWIRERSGIIERRWAGEGESVVDMSELAARQALQMAGVEAAELDVVIVATVSWPYQTPAAAPMVAERLGTKGAAFDISAACAGYCHGIALASDMVRGGDASNVLVVGVERLSDFTDKDDRGTAFIFADGAGAAVVSRSATPGIGPTVWGSDGAQWDVIAQKDSWIEVHEKDLGWPTIGMAGQTVFRWAVWGMAPVAQKALDAAGITADQLDAFIPHQANVRIIDAMAKQLHMPADIPIARDIAYTGNTSSASIPLAMERMVRHGEVPSGGLALQIGFGAGLSYAAQVVVIP